MTNIGRGANQVKHHLPKERNGVKYILLVFRTVNYVSKVVQTRKLPKAQLTLES